jgi:hypothetical protein
LFSTYTWRQSRKLIVESLYESREQCVSTSHYNVVEQEWAKIDITAANTVEYELMNTKAGINLLLCESSAESTFGTRLR